ATAAALTKCARHPWKSSASPTTGSGLDRLYKRAVGGRVAVEKGQDSSTGNARRSPAARWRLRRLPTSLSGRVVKSRCRHQDSSRVCRQTKRRQFLLLFPQALRRDRKEPARSQR